MPILEYPKLMYHPDGRTVRVADATEQAAYLAAGWSLAPISTAAGVSRIPAATVSTVIFAPDVKLRTMRLINDSTAICRFLYGDGASASHFSWILDPGERWEMPLVLESGNSKPEHNGLITAIWESAVGALQMSVTRFP